MWEGDKDDPIPQLTIFPVDSICDSCVAVPYHTDENIVIALQWSVIRQRCEWYDILVEFLQKKIREKS